MPFKKVVCLPFVYFLFILFLVSADSHQSPCTPNLDTPECLAAVQQLMADENRFWFGTSYRGVCPPYASYGAECSNPDEEHLSIATRMRASGDNSVDIIQQVLNVTYDAPAGRAWGWGGSRGGGVVCVCVCGGGGLCVCVWGGGSACVCGWSE